MTDKAKVTCEGGSMETSEPVRITNRRRQLLSRSQASLVELVLRLESNARLTLAHFRELDATEALARDSLAASINLAGDALDARQRLKDQPIELARRGGIARSENDPRTKLRAKAKQQWDRWKENPARFRSGAAFAHDFQKHHPIIENTKTVENWVSQWEAEARETAQRNRAG